MRLRGHLGWLAGSVVLGALAAGCGGRFVWPGAAAEGVIVYAAPDPSERERYCAWFGDARGNVLYFGASAFWSASREVGDPAGDLLEPGPQLVGRFDLTRERFLPPLVTGARDPRAGTWDVLTHPNGRVYFTTFFEAAGWIDPVTGASESFESAGPGLNELALGPDGRLLVTRYVAQGSVVVLDAEGRVLREHALEPPPGGEVWPKSVAFDPTRAEIWVTTDLRLPEAGAIGHDARVLDAESGRELRRIVQPEIQFVAFGPDGTGHRAEVEGARLFLHSVPPAGRELAGEPARRMLLDANFPATVDFVQELVPLPDGDVLVTRWSGRLHRVEAGGHVRSVSLPRGETPGLYYTAVPANGRLCATRCAGVEVVCAEVP